MVANPAENLVSIVNAGFFLFATTISTDCVIAQCTRRDWNKLRRMGSRMGTYTIDSLIEAGLASGLNITAPKPSLKTPVVQVVTTRCSQPSPR